MNWDDAVALFEMSQRSRGYAERTVGNRLELATRLRRQLDEKPLDDVVKLDLQRVLARGIAPSSMMRERTDMQAFFRFLRAEGVIAKDPAEALERVIVRRGMPRPFTVDEIQRMMASGSYHRTRVMIMLGYMHGLRAHEIAKVHGRDFDLRMNRLIVKGKGGKERSIPIHPLLAAEIPTMPADGYWFPARGADGREYIHWRSVSDLMTKAKRRAGVTDPRKTGHSLRHAFGTELVKAGADLITAQQLLGHASVATTQIYVATDDARLEAASAALPAPVVPIRSGRKRRAA